VDQVRIHTVDKDLAQCVVGAEVVQVDRRKEVVLDEPGVMTRYGVAPESIPDWLALVGDSSDGFPGLPGWGKKGAATVLARYRHLEDIPVSPLEWDIRVPGSVRMMATLAENLELALLFRDLATLRRDPPVVTDVEDLRWSGPTPAFTEMCRRVNAPTYPVRAEELAAARR
jgi:5'-3' exonuclease